MQKAALRFASAVLQEVAVARRPSLQPSLPMTRGLSLLVGLGAASSEFVSPFLACHGLPRLVSANLSRGQMVMSRCSGSEDRR